MDRQCDVCGQHAATGGNIRTIDGKDVTTNYCDECRSQVPLGHTGWTIARPYPWVRFAPQLLLVSLLIIVAIVLVRWLGR